MNKSSKFILLYYIFRFFSDFCLIYPVYLIFFIQNNISIFKISILLVIWCFIVVLFEIPTGAVADSWQRKYMLIIGLIYKAACFIIWFLFQNFSGFAVGFIFWGLQETFTSGTHEALLYDNLKHHNLEKEYDKITGRGHLFSKIAVGISLFAGGIAAHYNISIVLISSSITTITGIIPLLFIKEYKINIINDKQNESIILFNNIKKSIINIFKNKQILFLVIFSVILFGSIGSMEEFEQLYYNWLKIPIAFFGIIALIIMILQGIGNHSAYIFNRIFKSKRSIFFLSFFSGIFLISSIIYNSYFIIIFYALSFFFIGIAEVTLETRLQEKIKSENRAVSLSINNLGINFFAMIMIFSFGLFSKIINLISGFIFIGGILLIYSAVSFIITGINNRKNI